MKNIADINSIKNQHESKCKCIIDRTIIPVKALVSQRNKLCVDTDDRCNNAGKGFAYMKKPGKKTKTKEKDSAKERNKHYRGG